MGTIPDVPRRYPDPARTARRKPLRELTFGLSGRRRTRSSTYLSSRFARTLLYHTRRLSVPGFKLGEAKTVGTCHVDAH